VAPGALCASCACAADKPEASEGPSVGALGKVPPAAAGPSFVPQSGTSADRRPGPPTECRSTAVHWPGRPGRPPVLCLAQSGPCQCGGTLLRPAKRNFGGQAYRTADGVPVNRRSLAGASGTSARTFLHCRVASQKQCSPALRATATGRRPALAAFAARTGQRDTA
jgi:hypothetical protein